MNAGSRASLGVEMLRINKGLDVLIKPGRDNGVYAFGTPEEN